MQVRLIQIFARLMGALPLRMNHRVGTCIGLLAWHCRSSLRQISTINLQLCFPDWSTDKRNAIAKQSLIETGKALTEALWMWNRPADEVLSYVQESRTQQLLIDAKKTGKGILLATPHLGAWELCNLPLSIDEPILYMYQPPRMSALEDTIIGWRENLGGQPARLDQRGIRKVLTSLNKGKVVGILPDQEPTANGGVFSSFFGVKTNTMTLFNKLVDRTDAIVLFCYAERLPNAGGWRMHYCEPIAGTVDADPNKAALALNQSIEACVMALPEQYMWNYKRFRQLEDGTRRQYK